MPQHYKVHELLSRDELDKLEAFAREPGRTIDECHEWLQSQGFTLSRGAVGNWKRKFDVQDKFKASNEVARALVDAAKKEGTAAISDAAALQLSQMVFEQLVRMQSGEDAAQVTPKELWAASMALKNVVQAARHVEKLREEMKASQQAAIEQAERSLKTGASAGDVVQTIKAALGITG